MASSRLKSGLALGLGLGLKLYFAIFLRLYPTFVGGDLGGIGGLPMGGGRRMYGLSPTSVVRFEKTGDDDVASFISSVWLSDTCCVVVASCEFVTSCITTCWFRSALSCDSCSSICFPKSISHDTAYHSLCDT